MISLIVGEGKDALSPSSVAKNLGYGCGVFGAAVGNVGRVKNRCMAAYVFAGLTREWAGRALGCTSVPHVETM
jgi:hypothetical protein